MIWKDSVSDVDMQVHPPLMIKCLMNIDIHV